MAERRPHPAPGDRRITQAIEDAIVEATATGTAIVGDISNTLATYEPLARGPLSAAVVFYELIRFNADDPEAFVEGAQREIEALRSDEDRSDRIVPTLAAHAPYSVAPLVVRFIRQPSRRPPFAPGTRPV